ncbi:hypothetical protein IWW38_002066 [Coemansia aciculifera]|uniref:Uncharacterized protein n=1 Tax=Coemansia aciculifera TaxID=417176 RepID=A0ACC1M5F8_9FUNG|nr:hypothetical protein IWW38_002066 [Coemansia aciculifera]
MSNPLIGSIHALKRRPRSDEALLLLQRLSSQVRPIMQARGWRVTTLREFFPANSQLLGLNVNRGQEIRIRLRPSHDPSQFLIYEDLLGTMLHELVHIVRGPHDKEFYGLLDVLKAEAEALLAKGYLGDGFFSKGVRVGVGVSHNLPRYAVREQTVRAVEARARRAGGLGGGGPRTLGAKTDQHWVAMQARHTPAQMAALAVERRLRDEKWCGESMAGVVKDTRPDNGSDDEVVLVEEPCSGSEVVVIHDSDSEPEALVHHVIDDDDI